VEVVGICSQPSDAPQIRLLACASRLAPYVCLRTRAHRSAACSGDLLCAASSPTAHTIIDVGRASGGAS
jgi:hypothetical protein